MSSKKRNFPPANTQLISTALGAALGLLLVTSSLATAAESTAYFEEKLPLWEVGIGAGGVSVPAYKGSGTQRSFAAPLPYLVYRGEILHANRDGVGVSVFSGNEWKLDLSASGSLPVKSSGTAREGMENLPVVAELGPMLLYDLAETDRYGKWTLRLPVRYAFALQKNGLHGVGWVASPGIRVTNKVKLFERDWDWGLNLNLNYQGASFNHYYYGVGTADALVNRPVYNAKSGYSGTSVTTGILRRSGNLVFAGFVGASNMSAAAFADSPLVERKTNVFGGFSLTWVLHQSDVMVHWPND